MRLINTATLDLEDFMGCEIPPYAILSHTWGSEEVTLQQWIELRRTGDLAIAGRAGCAKIRTACQVAAQYGAGYLWVDTNCIDKTSSAELSEAINSMFTWYKEGHVCLVYLDDFGGETLPDGAHEKVRALSTCRWFSRGWTLQELLAPCQEVHLFSRTWNWLGSRSGLMDELSLVTGVQRKYLAGHHGTLQQASISRRMSWAAGRQTTRPEDTAYCLLGIFAINMPLLYGEGHNAFRRLQEEIMKVSIDHTLFAWEWPEGWNPAMGWVSFLAPSPSCFRNSGDLSPIWMGHKVAHPTEQMFSMTNYGLSISVHLHPLTGVRLAFAVLLCGPAPGPDMARLRCAIPLVKTTDAGHSYARLNYPPRPVQLMGDLSSTLKQVYISRAPFVPVVVRFLPAGSWNQLPDQAHIMAVVQMADRIRCQVLATHTEDPRGGHLLTPWLAVGSSWVGRNEAVILLTTQSDEEKGSPQQVQPAPEKAVLLYAGLAWTDKPELNLGLHLCPTEAGRARAVLGAYPWARWARPGVGQYESSDSFDIRLTYRDIVIEYRNDFGRHSGVTVGILSISNSWKNATPLG